MDPARGRGRLRGDRSASSRSRAPLGTDGRSCGWRSIFRMRGSTSTSPRNVCSRPGMVRRAWRRRRSEGLVRDALEHPRGFPPLRQAVVPGDRVVLAYDPEIPEGRRRARGDLPGPPRARASRTGASRSWSPRGPGAKHLGRDLPGGVVLAVHDPEDRSPARLPVDDRDGEAGLPQSAPDRRRSRHPGGPARIRPRARVSRPLERPLPGRQRSGDDAARSGQRRATSRPIATTRGPPWSSRPRSPGCWGASSTSASWRGRRASWGSSRGWRRRSVERGDARGRPGLVLPRPGAGGAGDRGDRPPRHADPDRGPGRRPGRGDADWSSTGARSWRSRGPRGRSDRPCAG